MNPFQAFEFARALYGSLSPNWASLDRNFCDDGFVITMYDVMVIVYDDGQVRDLTHEGYS